MAALIRLGVVLGTAFCAFVVLVIVLAWRRDRIRSREQQRRIDRVSEWMH